MKKLKWWQWTLIAFFGLAVLGSLIDEPNKSTAVKTTSQYANINAQFTKLVGDDMFAMTFNAQADPTEIEKTVRDHCGTREFCKIFGWTDPEFAPRGFPMTDREVEAQVLSYGINRSTGYEQFSWDCSLFENRNGIDCHPVDGSVEAQK